MTTIERVRYLEGLGIPTDLAESLIDGTLKVTDIDVDYYDKLNVDALKVITDETYTPTKEDFGKMEVAGKLRPITERHVSEKELTDEEIDVLMTDWFARDGKSFTHIRTTGRIGWEDTLEEGDSYSAYFLEAPDKEELLKRAYSLAKDMIVVMDPPFKVFIKISKDKDSYTDGKTVVVSTSMFNDVELTAGGMLDVFLGVTIHEGCHLLYTDFEVVSLRKHDIIHQLFNIIEDERIEERLGEEKPGLARFLEKMKYYYFDIYYLDYTYELESSGREETLFEKIFNIILRVIRYPSYLNEDDIVYFGHHLFDIKAALLPFPNTSSESLKAAEKIFQIIKEFYKEELRDMTKDMTHDEIEGLLDSVGIPMSGKELDEDTLGKLAEASLDRDSEKIIEKTKSITGDPTTKLDSSDMSTILRGGTLAEEIEGRIEKGRDTDTLFKKSGTNEQYYKESLERVRRYIPSITKIVQAHCKEYKLIHKSMRSGVLDTSKLAEAYQGVSSVYIREGEVRTDKVAVAILIDESGSMHGPCIKAARDTAVLLNEAIGKIPAVELYIYGHTGDIRYSGATELTIYREKTYSPKYALGDVDARYENRDGVAIYEVAKRVRSFTKYPVLYFILSDGAPAAHGYHGKSAIDHVKRSVEQVEKLDFSVVQVCMNHCYDPSSMFKHFVILEDMSNLAINLGRVIKKAIMKKATVTIT